MTWGAAVWTYVFVFHSSPNLWVQKSLWACQRDPSSIPSPSWFFNGLLPSACTKEPWEINSVIMKRRFHVGIWLQMGSLIKKTINQELAFPEVLPSRQAHAHWYHFPYRDCSLRIVLVHHMFQAPASAAFRCCFCCCLPLVVRQCAVCDCNDLHYQDWIPAFFNLKNLDFRDLQSAENFGPPVALRIFRDPDWLHGARKTFVCPGAGCSGLPCLEKHHWGLCCSPQQEMQSGNLPTISAMTHQKWFGIMYI